MSNKVYVVCYRQGGYCTPTFVSYTREGAEKFVEKNYHSYVREHHVYVEEVRSDITLCNQVSIGFVDQDDQKE